MGVELNFITKPDKGWPATKVIGVFFTLLILACATTLWTQWSAANGVVQASEEARLELQKETLALMTAPTTGERSDTELRALAKELTSIESDSVPHGTIYTDIVLALGESVTLNTFDSMDGRLVQISATFGSMEDVTAATTRLQQIEYIQNVRPSDTAESGGSYNAGITIMLDGRSIGQAESNREQGRGENAPDEPESEVNP